MHPKQWLRPKGTQNIYNQESVKELEYLWKKTEQKKLLLLNSILRGKIIDWEKLLFSGLIKKFLNVKKLKPAISSRLILFCLFHPLDKEDRFWLIIPSVLMSL